eukprot:COSAG04_NODE_2968_length_3335_cov_1.601051_2_plen_65_part_00
MGILFVASAVILRRTFFPGIFFFHQSLFFPPFADIDVPCMLRNEEAKEVTVPKTLGDGKEGRQR